MQFKLVIKLDETKKPTAVVDASDLSHVIQSVLLDVKKTFQTKSDGEFAHVGSVKQYGWTYYLIAEWEYDPK